MVTSELTSFPSLKTELQTNFPNIQFDIQKTEDEVQTFWIPKEQLHKVLRYLKLDAPKPFLMLYDLTAIDERVRQRDHRKGDFTLVYHLLSFDRNRDIRLKVPLMKEELSILSITSLWASANWYEREVW